MKTIWLLELKIGRRGADVSGGGSRTEGGYDVEGVEA